MRLSALLESGALGLRLLSGAGGSADGCAA